MRFPLHLIVIDGIGALFAALGLWGALAGGGTVLPVLANARVAWSLIAIGVLMMVYAAVELVRAELQRRRRKGPGEQ